eukprot:8018807-Alexandrium_andersonii.AAC.1
MVLVGGSRGGTPPRRSAGRSPRLCDVVARCLPRCCMFVLYVRRWPVYRSVHLKALPSTS